MDLIQRFYKKSGVIVARKLGDKSRESSFRPNLQFEVDLHKLRQLASESMQKWENDIYFRWYRAELDLAEHGKDVRVNVMSAVVAYLAFLNEHPRPMEVQHREPFEIFYNIYRETLATMQLKPLQMLQLD